MAIPNIEWPSAASLFVQAKQAGNVIGSATGFIVERDSRKFLVTNRHVLRGTGTPPDQLEIAQHVAGKLGFWESRDERLFDNSGQPLWFEHPDKPVEIDVAALPLTNTGGIDVLVYDPWSAGHGFATGVAEPLSIIGFPFGVTGGGALGVWVRGFVATEPSLDWNGLPCFLIDSRTRQGQSGSPVIVYTGGGATPMADGGTSFFNGPVWDFVGVYSGRINAQSDLGFVWKARVVREIIEAKRLAT
jgi:hypothetical protein